MYFLLPIIYNFNGITVYLKINALFYLGVIKYKLNRAGKLYNIYKPTCIIIYIFYNYYLYNIIII